MPELFVWRHVQRNSIRDAGYMAEWRALRCKWCDTQLCDRTHNAGKLWLTDDEQVCPFCGWSHRFMTGLSDGFGTVGDEFYFWRELRQFAIGDQGLALSELGTHLRRRFTDTYALSPRRFEELVEDVFRTWGYHTRLTAASRDDGVDIYLLERDGSVNTVVEVKRYAAEHKVGIEVVDRLLGVQLRKGVPKAMLVTSSAFTHPARVAAQAVACRGYSLELVDANALLNLLGVYNEDLPPLPEVIRAWHGAV